MERIKKMQKESMVVLGMEKPRLQRTADIPQYEPWDSRAVNSQKSPLCSYRFKPCGPHFVTVRLPVSVNQKKGVTCQIW